MVESLEAIQVAGKSQEGINIWSRTCSAMLVRLFQWETPMEDGVWRQLDGEVCMGL